MLCPNKSKCHRRANPKPERAGAEALGDISGRLVPVDDIILIWDLGWWLSRGIDQHFRHCIRILLLPAEADVIINLTDFDLLLIVRYHQGPSSTLADLIMTLTYWIITIMTLVLNLSLHVMKSQKRQTWRFFFDHICIIWILQSCM